MVARADAAPARPDRDALDMAEPQVEDLDEPQVVVGPQGAVERNTRFDGFDYGTDSDEEKERERATARAYEEKLTPEEKKKSNQAFSTAFSSLFKHKYPDLAPEGAVDDAPTEPKVDLFEGGGCAWCGEACWAKKQCGRCRSVVYCSRACQKDAWRGGHKAECEDRPEDCGHCGLPIPAKLKCGFCRQVYYCGSECQRTDWRKGHRTACSREFRVEPPKPPPKPREAPAAEAEDDDEGYEQVRLTAEAQEAAAAGDWDRAEACFRGALEATEDAFGRDDDSVAAALANLGTFLAKRGRYDDSDPLLKRSMKIYEDAAGGPEDANALLVKSWIADNMRMRYDLEAAEKLFREILRDAREVYGETHAEVAVALNNLAGVLTEQGTPESWPQAKKYGAKALAIANATLGPDHPKTVAYRKSWENP